MIIAGDVLDVLQRLSSEEKFAIVIADPPYNIGKDFGNNKDTKPLPVYIQWTEQWIKRCMELLADDGIMYIYGLPEILARISSLYPIEEQRWLVWHYINKTVPTATFWQRSHESILCLWQPGFPRPSLEIDQIRVPYGAGYLHAIGKVRKETRCRYSRHGRKTIYNGHENGALPRDVIKVPALAGGAGFRERWFVCRDCGNKIFHPKEIRRHEEHNILKHPTQKPMKLTKQLLLSRINGTGGRALIPFAGSGSECVVSQALGIDFVGIEINEEYVNFAQQWLSLGIQP